MAIYKSPYKDASSVTLHDKELDIVNGFVEISDEDLTPEIEKTLTVVLGFTLAQPEEIDAVLSTVASNDHLAAEAAERAVLMAQIKEAGLKIDGRKNLAWVRERYNEFVAQGLISGDDNNEPPAEPEAPEPAPKTPAKASAQEAKTEA